MGILSAEVIEKTLLTGTVTAKDEHRGKIDFPGLKIRTFAGNVDRHTRENGYPAF
jgi:hypothetical protein